VIKKGIRRGIHRYLCQACKHSFSSKRRPIKLQSKIFQDYFYHRQTAKELAAKYYKSERWIREQVHHYKPIIRLREGRHVVLVLDATFFGKRVDKFGLMIAKDIKSKEAVSYHFIESETNEEYVILRQDIEKKRYTIQAIIIDGRRGLFSLFKGIPIQMCHFHQLAIITRYLTKNPKLEASIKLKRIASYLTHIKQSRFEYLLNCWYQKYQDFLNEKTLNEETNRWRYTHRRLRSAFRSLKTHLPYLFTYQKYPTLHIQNTTNSLDGGVFAPMKMLLKIHRGIGIEMKKKLITDYLENRL